MNLAALALPGFEEVTADEVRALVGVEPDVRERVVLFDADAFHATVFAYQVRSASRVLAVLCSFAVSRSFDATKAALLASLERAAVSPWLQGMKRFGISCDRQGSHDFSSPDIVGVLAVALRDLTTASIDFKRPEVSLQCLIIGDAGYVCVDLCGFALDKRDYRVFPHPVDLKGNLAYALLHVARYDGAGSLVDAFCKSGAIAIEAALLAARQSPQYYRKDAYALLRLPPFLSVHPRDIFVKEDEQILVSAASITAMDSAMPNLRAAEKNAKIAGVNKAIRFSRVDTDWLDTKFESHSVQFAVSQLPSASQRLPERVAVRILDTFFLRLAAVFSSSGTAVFLARDVAQVITAATKHGFTAEGVRKVVRGTATQHIITFKRKRG